MKQELWRRAEALFHGALQRSPDSRRAFLDEACGEDQELQRLVDTLVSKDEQAGSFLEAPALGNDLATPVTRESPVGRQYGPYRILSLLGAGGMGEVYRAHDGRLGRDVAIKTLPPEFARDPTRLARLQREARTLASLNHPNIAAIYGLEESAEGHYLVLELVEGETLHGPLALATALDLACQVAEALEAAHEHGIIHRDLKPANVRVTPQGRVKVLDFGLAKAIWATEAKPDPSRPAPEIGSGTAAGHVVGTPGYMSPEQARGLEVDQRTDIWAFGCFLFELLTGRRAFENGTLSDAAAAVLEQDPDWQALPASAPARVRDLLHRCLEKDASRRLDNIAEARTTLEDVQSGRHRWRTRRRWRPAAGLEVPGTPWLLEEKLGQGGFGEVWLARHRQLKEPRVFKFCLREDRVRALKREMTLFRVWRARVGDHPHLVQLLGVNLDQPPFYLEEEYVSGRDLRTWCAAQGGIGQVPVELRLELVAQAAEGLSAAHEAGIIHRDIKPGNILVGAWKTGGAAGDGRESPTAKLTDFGIGHVVSTEALAGITATGLTTGLGPTTSSSPMGTHAYLAPEVLMGRPATVQSDLYSMGVVLYQLLVQDFGQPVTTDWARAIPDAVEQEDLQRCFAGRPEERFGSARELAEHLRSISARREARAGVARAAFERGTSKIASLAVLPFANLSADADNEFLSDGIADDLLAALSRVPELRVPGRTSCFAFKGKAEDLRKVGQALGVETVLEGSVRRDGGRLRVTAQLINVADGFHLWSERYDREMADVFAVQDEITRAITTALMPKLAAERPATLVKPYTGSVDAYELCLRARYHHQRRTPEGLGMALRLFEQAIARDPNCATAHAGVAHVCLLLCYFGGLPTREGMTRMKAAALRALELDDTLAITHVRMGDALCFKDWDWAGAEREFLRALELDPDSAEARWRYGVFLWARLRNAEALVQMQKALEIDPFSLDANWLLGWVYLSLRQLDEAGEVAGKLLAMDANVWLGYHIRAVSRALKGLWAEAIEDIERSAAIEGGPASLGVLCWAYARVGKLAEARRTLERLEQMTTKRIVPPTWLALAYDALGADAQARACMERAVEERHMLLVHLSGFMGWVGWLSGYRSLLDQHGL